MDKLNIRQLFDIDTCTYTYVLWDDLTSEGLIIDPVLEQLDRDVNYLNKLQINLKYILETHVHADHITSASKLRNKTSAKICYGSESGVKGADILFADNDQISLGAHIVKGLTQSTIKYERKCNPNVGDSINKEDFVNREKNMERPYPKRFKIAVPANMYCGKKQK